jgi:single-stranded-DNA-specific exonuclease
MLHYYLAIFLFDIDYLFVIICNLYIGYWLLHNFHCIIPCMKKWSIKGKLKSQNSNLKTKEIIDLLLNNRGIISKTERDAFLHPSHPKDIFLQDVGIDKKEITKGIKRIIEAIEKKESIVVHADYDADGITAGAVMWETLHSLGARVMPYVPLRDEEGRGMSVESIDRVRELYDPSLIITVDHGVTAHKGIAHAQKIGIDVVVTDHHEKPDRLPDCPIIHSSTLSGSGVSWFVARELIKTIELQKNHSIKSSENELHELLGLAAIGLIADCVLLTGPNRSIVMYGLKELQKTKRVGIKALLLNSSIEQSDIDTYSVSHMIAPRINAMGRLEHALDALRLLCTTNEDKAQMLAQELGLTNKRRQDMTVEMFQSAKTFVSVNTDGIPKDKLLFVESREFNQGIVGLVAGKLAEEYHRPAVVIAVGEEVSKGSARSVSGLNIFEFLKTFEHMFINIGGHPLAAGFTIDSSKIPEFREKLIASSLVALEQVDLVKTLAIDAEIPLSLVSKELWNEIQSFRPFGFGNIEPVFCTKGVSVSDARTVGKERNHLKLKVASPSTNHYSIPASHTPLTTNHYSLTTSFDAIAFSFGDLFKQLSSDTKIDVAYTIDMNEWNGNRKLQLKVKDIHIKE